jgi:type IV secretory pathway component VirB8
MERDWSARDQSSDAAIDGDIEAASMFSIIAVFSMICMIAETLACAVRLPLREARRTVVDLRRQIASLASSAAMKLAIERPASDTIRSSTA